MESKNETPGAPLPTLNLNDLAAVVAIIDAASERGAFKGNELLNVGTTRQKFVDYVNARAPKKDEPEEDKKEG